MATNPESTQPRDDLKLITVLLFLLSLIGLFLLPEHPLLLSLLIFWLLLVSGAALVWLILGTSETREGVDTNAAPRFLRDDEYPSEIREVMQVREAGDVEGGAFIRGKLRVAPEVAFSRLKGALAGTAWPRIQPDANDETVIILAPNQPLEQAAARPIRRWVNWSLFLVTIVTTTWVGAAHRGVNLLIDPSLFTVGLPYSLALLGILGFHELGHYYTAKRYKINVTPPYFIPIPFGLGTFGAFISLRSPPENRTAMFDVAVAGPLAGLVLAIPALFIGLQLSAQIPDGLTTLGAPVRGTSVGSSIVMAIVAWAALGPEAFSAGTTWELSPLAFAGWLGLFVTALNLLPVGQLDGGHMARGMFGSRAADTIGTIAKWSLFALALFVWPGLLLWVVIVSFVAGRGVPPLNDITPISRGRKLLGFVTFGILLLIVVPFPSFLRGILGLG
jgi:membrane-associated protease RseP (regulator of RpoE activity)